MIRKLALVFAAAALIAGLCRIVSTPGLATLDTTLSVPSNLDVQGNLQVRGTMPTIARSTLEQDNFAVFTVPLTDCRVWDAVATVLSGTAASDDLALTTGTWGTAGPFLSTGDVKALGTTTRRCRFMFQIPPSYVNGQSVRINLYAATPTTVADTSATLDVEAFEIDKNSASLVSGSDLVTTSAQSINFIATTAYSFDLTSTSLSKGDWLDVRISITIVDAASVTGVLGTISTIDFLLDIKG